MLILVLGLGLALAATSVRAEETFAPNQARAHAGQRATVEGAVSAVHIADSGVTFLDIGGDFPNNAFAAVIFKDDAGKFPDVDSLTGKTVAISGAIRLYQGKPEIVLNDPAQIKLK
jgi:DNA/RNA endonuclease YhcR with UshA esterase domain